MVVWKLFPSWFVPGFNLHMDAAVDQLSHWVGSIDRVRDLILPIGLSFATFRAVDQLIKVRLEILPPLSPLQHFAYAFFPSVLVIGPVIEYTEIEQRVAEPCCAGGPRTPSAACSRSGSVRSRSSCWPTRCAAARTSSRCARTQGPHWTTGSSW